MKKWIVILMVYLGGSSAYANRVTDYTTVSCRLSQSGELLSESVTLPMLTLNIDDHLGRFVQWNWANTSLGIQYQLLIEDDIRSKPGESLLVLQNLKVGEQEVSVEVVAHEVSVAQIANGDFAVSCVPDQK